MNQGFSLQLLIKSFHSHSAIPVAFTAFKPVDLSAICFNASTHIRILAFTIELLPALHLIEPSPSGLAKCRGKAVSHRLFFPDGSHRYFLPNRASRSRASLVLCFRLVATKKLTHANKQREVSHSPVHPRRKHLLPVCLPGHDIHPNFKRYIDSQVCLLRLTC